MSVIEMSSCHNVPVLDPRDFLQVLLAAERPGSDKILAFYDSRVNAICRDGKMMLLPLDDHLCHRGDGLFESINYRDNKIFGLEAHLDRMRSGAKLIDLAPPFSFDDIRGLILEVAKAGQSPHGDLRVFLSRGPGGFGVHPGECPASSLYIVALKTRLPTSELYDHGLTAFSSAYPPKQEYLAQIKNTNYMPNVLMAQEASRKNMDVAITFDEFGFMGEAAIANIAIVDKDGVLRSPEIKRILPGTTLLAALALARQRMPVREGPIHMDEISQAREMMLFTSASLCVGIVQFNGVQINDGKPGPVALWLKNELLEFMLANGTPF